MNYNKKTVRDVDVKGKRVLCRCDFNVPQDKETGAITDDNGLCGIAIAGVGTRFRLVFIVAQMVGHFSVESCLNADFLQQAIELAEIFRGFEIFGQFVSQSLQLFFVHKLTCF